MSSPRIMREMEEWKFLEDENHLLQEQNALLEQDILMLGELNYTLSEKLKEMESRVELLNKINQKQEQKATLVLGYVDKLKKQNTLMNKQNLVLIDLLQDSLHVEEEQLLFSQNISSDYEILMIQNEDNKSRIDEIKTQISSFINLEQQFASLNDEVKKQSQNEKINTEEQIKAKIEGAIQQILQGDIFEQLTKKVEKRISNQFEQEQQKIVAELQILEANQLEFQAESEPILQKHRIKQIKLSEQNHLLSTENTKLFYQNLYKQVAAKLIAAIVLYSDLVSYATTLTEKVGKLSGSVIGNLFGSAPGGPVISSLISFAIEEGTAHVKGRIQEKKIKNTVKSLPDPKEAIPIAELIARRLTQDYAETILQMPNDEIEEGTEQCSRAIYGFLKKGNLTKYADISAEEKVKMIINHVREERVIEDKRCDIPSDTDFSMIGLMRPVSDSPATRNRMESVANKAELARRLSETSSVTNNIRTRALQTSLLEQEKKYADALHSLEDKMDKKIKEQEKKYQTEIMNLKRQLGMTQSNSNEGKKVEKKGFLRF